MLRQLTRKIITNYIVFDSFETSKKINQNIKNSKIETINESNIFISWNQISIIEVLI